MKCTLCGSEHYDEYSLTGYRRCENCGMVRMDSALWPNQEKEKSRYEQHQNLLTEPGYISYLSTTAQPVRDLISHGATGLDYGCGPVEGMKFVLPEYKVQSFDPYFYPQKELLNNRYDFVICCEAAEHFFHPDEQFLLLARLVRPGGYLLVRSLLLVNEEKFEEWHYRRDPTHVSFYAEPTVKWIADKFGFELLRLESPHWLLRKA